MAEEEFQAKFQAAWEEIRRYRAEAIPREVGGDADPRHRLADEFYQIYLDNRPGPIAGKALTSACAMWGNVGASDKMREALRRVGSEEDVWYGVISSLKRSLYNEGREEEWIPLLEQLVEQVVPLESRSALLDALADAWMDKGETEKARRAFTQVVEWNAHEELAGRARGYLYELDSLNIGQPAPDFALQDVDGNPVALNSYHGRVLVLHFWSTDCGACHMIYPHLRDIAQGQSEDAVCLVGISWDRDFDALRARVAAERFTWPQLCEGIGASDTMSRLYNVNAIPTAYVIAGTGDIAFKLVGGDRGEELKAAVRSLL